MAVLSSVVDQHIGRLEELLAKYEEIEEEEAAERCDRTGSIPARHSRATVGTSPPRPESCSGRWTLFEECGMRKRGNGEGEMADDKWGGFAGSEPGQLAGSEPVLQPIMPLDLPVKVRSWELTVYPRSHIRRCFKVTWVGASFEV